MRMQRCAIRIAFVTFALVTAGSSATAATVEEQAVGQAQSAATAWLALTDAGNYAKSWDEAAAMFKAAITRPDWEKAVTGARAPLGAVQERKLLKATFTSQLPGAPDGEYVVLQFQTRFANRASAVETVTPMRDKDGSFRVSGYYIQ